jgi:hypothetical protein
MNPKRKVAFLVLMSGAACLAQTISGSVVSVAGEPLKNASLTLTMQQPPRNPGAPAPPQPQPFSASSDAQGNFIFEDLEPGVYFICSDKPGYLRTCRRENSTRGDLDLAAGQTLTGIAIKMTPQGVISGKVTDEYGDPYPNAQVSAARWGYVGGHKQLQPAGRGTSNVEGAFAIGSLAAGSYYITFAPQPVSVSPAAIQKGPEETFVTTYYPSVTGASSAIAVQVTAGEATRGIDIRMHKTHAYRIRGKVAGSSSEAAPSSISVLLYASAGAGLRPTTLQDGVFDYEGVLPGLYSLLATARGAAYGVARQTVTVGSADVDDLVLRLGPGAEITGTISIEGSAPPLPQQQPPVVSLTPTVGTSGGTNYDLQAPDGGKFAIHQVPPAVYQVNVVRLPPGTYLKSILFGGQDVSKAPLDLTSGSGGTMNVTLSPHAGDIGGVVHGAQGMPLPDVLVTLWTPGAAVEGVPDFTRSTTTDANGQFKFASLPPGEYRVAAWEQVDYGLALAPDFRIEFDSQAAAVKLDENAHANIDAPLIGREAIEAEAAKLQ